MVRLARTRDGRSEDRQAGRPAGRGSRVERAAEKLMGAKGGPPADASAPAAPPFPVAEPAGPGLVEEGLEEALAAGAAGAAEAASGPGGDQIGSASCRERGCTSV